MKFELKRKLVLDNIYFLLKEKNMRISELEEKAEVSPGLISRMAKEGSTTKISIEFLVSVASVLGVSVDSLVNYDYRSLNKTDMQLLCFFDKLKKQTIDGLLFWIKETQRDMDNIHTYTNLETDHPLFTGVMDAFNKPVHEYVSKFSESGHATPAGSIYHTNFSGSKSIFIAPVKYNDNDNTVNYEVYFADLDYIRDEWYDSEPVCATKIEGFSVFNEILTQLYTALLQSDKHAKLSSSAWDAIDDFMNPGEQLPF